LYNCYLLGAYTTDNK